MNMSFLAAIMKNISKNLFGMEGGKCDSGLLMLYKLEIYFLNEYSFFEHED